MPHSKTVQHRLVFIAIAMILFCVTLVALSSRALVLNNPKLSDAVVVWGGDDVNYYAGLSLMQSTGARYMFVCLEQNDFDIAGAELRRDREFITRSAGPLANHIDICVGNSDDILPELAEKLVGAGYRSAVIVAPQQYSRADYIEGRKRLPNYSWSVSATQEPQFSRSWWRSRGRTKNFLFGLERLVAAIASKA